MATDLRTAYPEFAVFAAQADQYVADQCISGTPIAGISNDYATHACDGWLKILFHYAVHGNDQHQAGQYTRLKQELRRVTSDQQISDLLTIQGALAGIVILEPSSARKDLEALIAELEKAITLGML
ncbi:hypothetical protein [Aliiroseovarius halocynthiae]|uniref:Uncharacterized protein n=1 Tax=Aliiroseovarius halocynthiae TaxID=985055 RepID=A0A545SLT7_9RHOB|nr:hypothetical protein [Aliiroseovarius halocynthiae]TQV65921.1 hypothetical protein FIL88_15660 [Aliiroseovarius halocynthiae]